jgi:hypothetical protein
VNCHLSLALSNGVPYLLTEDNVISRNWITMPLCHFSIVYCHRKMTSETFTFTMSALLNPTSWEIDSLVRRDLFHDFRGGRNCRQ